MPRNIIMAASLPASADKLFDMYLDAGEHAAFTGINSFSHLYHSFEKIWKGVATVHR